MIMVIAIQILLILRVVAPPLNDFR